MLQSSQSSKTRAGNSDRSRKDVGRGKTRNNKRQPSEDIDVKF